MTDHTVAFERFSRAKRRESEVIAKLERQLQDAGLTTDRLIAAEGFRFDLSATSSDGRQVLLDVLILSDARMYKLRKNDYRARAFLVRSQTNAGTLFVLAPLDDGERVPVELPF